MTVEPAFVLLDGAAVAVVPGEAWRFDPGTRAWEPTDSSEAMLAPLLPEGALAGFTGGVPLPDTAFQSPGKAPVTSP